MATLLDLTKSATEEHTPLIRIVTALLDDHMVRMRHADPEHGIASLLLAIQVLIENSYAGVDLTTELRPMPKPDDDTDLSPVKAVFVIPLASLHIDPWTRITVWATGFGLRVPVESDRFEREIGKVQSKILQPAGSAESAPLYVDLHRAEVSVPGSGYGRVIDELVSRIDQVPLVKGASPWWVASVVSAGWKVRVLGPITAKLMPAYEAVD